MNNLLKRIILGSIMGGLFGVLCFSGFSSNPEMPAEVTKYQVWSWDNLMMWSTIANRYVLGFFVAVMWFITVHPCFKFKMYPFFRWAVVGFLVSLPMALWALMWDNVEMAKQGFYYVMIAWTIMWAIIDIVITKIAGEGKDLFVEK